MHVTLRYDAHMMREADGKGYKANLFAMLASLTVDRQCIMGGEPKTLTNNKRKTMKLFKIEFNDLYVEAENEEQAKDTLYDYLAGISANDLESETLESSTDYLNLVDVINEK